VTHEAVRVMVTICTACIQWFIWERGTGTGTAAPSDAAGNLNSMKLQVLLLVVLGSVLYNTPSGSQSDSSAPASASDPARSKLDVAASESANGNVAHNDEVPTSVLSTATPNPSGNENPSESDSLLPVVPPRSDLA
jgi:hypothetical protein